ncbi:MAG: matrixin family metalloprotease [Planctomycetota bacterium]
MRTCWVWGGIAAMGLAFMPGIGGLQVKADNELTAAAPYPWLMPADGLLPHGVAFCYAPGTDPTIVAYYEQLKLRGLQDPKGDPDFFIYTRWPGGGQGDPHALTWSLVPDGVYCDGRYNEIFSRMDALFGGNRQLWISKIQACFDRWASFSGLTFTRIRYNGAEWDDGAAWGSPGLAGRRGDVRIAMAYIDGANNVLGYSYYPDIGDTILDSSENWGSPASDYRFFRNVLMHENGHGYGIAHVCPPRAKWLMEPYMSTTYDGPQHDDLRAIQTLYGDIYEGNDSQAQATNLGTLQFGSTLYFGLLATPSYGTTLCLDGYYDLDWFKFTVTGPARATCTITPRGTTYENMPQDPYTGACPSGNMIDTRCMANMSLQILSSSGVLATADSRPICEAETLTDVALPGGAGTFYLKVYSAPPLPPEAQLYYIQLRVDSTGRPGDLNCDGAVNFDDINPFVLALSDPAGYATAYPNCNIMNGDCNGDGRVDFDDINPFVALLTNP